MVRKRVTACVIALITHPNDPLPSQMVINAERRAQRAIDGTIAHFTRHLAGEYGSISLGHPVRMSAAASHCCQR